MNNEIQESYYTEQETESGGIQQEPQEKQKIQALIMRSIESREENLNSLTIRLRWQRVSARY